VNQFSKRRPSRERDLDDLSTQAIGIATQRARAVNLGNVSLVAEGLTHFDRSAEPDLFDVLKGFDATIW
jgi:hypothetical protein